MPRWGGDTNFMPVIGQTRVLPELLAETYAKLQPLFEERLIAMSRRAVELPDGGTLRSTRPATARWSSCCTPVSGTAGRGTSR